MSLRTQSRRRKPERIEEIAPRDTQAELAIIWLALHLVFHPKLDAGLHLHDRRHRDIYLAAKVLHQQGRLRPADSELPAERHAAIRANAEAIIRLVRCVWDSCACPSHLLLVEAENASEDHGLGFSAGYWVGRLQEAHLRRQAAEKAETLLRLAHSPSADAHQLAEALAT